VKTYNSIEEFEREWPRAVDEAVAAMSRDIAAGARVAWASRANDRLDATKSHYLRNLKIEETPDAVVVTIPAGMPAAVDRGTKGFDLKPGFFAPKSKSLLLERAPGDKRWRTVTDSSGQRRRIPLDGGWPEKPGGANWKHPGIAPRDITKESVKEMKSSVLPELLAAFCVRVTV
jgi:hypothetical protein